MKALASVLVVACIAGSAQAITVSSREIGSSAGYQARVNPVYTGQAGPYSAFAAATGAIGFDDYGATTGDSSTVLASLVFVGGVSVAGDTIDLQFYTPSGNLFNSTALALPQAGNFIWTITFGAQPDGSDSTFVVPTNGILQLVASSTSGTTAGTGRWFLTGTAPVLGTNNAAFGAGSATPVPYQAFSLNAVPTPASLALMGLGGLVIGRRRR
ncbi:MAG: PEP-CTERM sorting domain-containing protein [Phycisphaerales bacterium]|jgi:uncharacterized protein (TIGR03382 family)